MALTESQRRRLHADLERALGLESADAMMQAVPPIGWDDVARQPMVDAQFVAVRGEMAQLRAELKGEMAELRAELKGEMAQLRAEFTGLSKRTAAMNAVTSFASSVTTAGLVLGAMAIVR